MTVTAELPGCDMRRLASVEAIWCGDGGCVALDVACDGRGRAIMRLTASQIRGMLHGEASLEMKFTDSRGRVRTAAVCGCFDNFSYDECD